MCKLKRDVRQQVQIELRAIGRELARCAVKPVRVPLQMPRDIAYNCPGSHCLEYARPPIPGSWRWIRLHFGSTTSVLRLHPSRRAA